MDAIGEKYQLAHENGSTEDMLESVFKDVIHTEADLFDDQLEAIEFAWKKPFSALFLDVGRGKTVVSLTVIDRLLTHGYDGKILIIAPIRVATRVWMREHRLWEHLAYMRPHLIRVDGDDVSLIGFSGAAKTAEKNRLRCALLDSERSIHVINQEAVGWLVDEMAKHRRWDYRVVVFDESSRLRDHNSVVFKSLKRVLHKIERFHQLTATPASQTYMHLFSQLYLLDKGTRLGINITRFRERYFTQNKYIHTWTIRPGAAEEIESRIADICLVQRRVKDFQTVIRPVELPPPVMKQYRDFERDSVLALPEGPIEAVNGAALCGKLVQFASGAVYDESRRACVVHDEKIDELRQLVDETLDNPVLVSYWFKSSLARLRKAFPDAALMDREGKAEKPWNQGRFKMMLVHPQSVAHGLNLQHGGHHLVIFDLFWSLELFTQLVGRLDRTGQTSTVMVYLLSATGTMDHTVSANLQLLQSAEEAMFKRLQALRRKHERE